MLRLSIFAAALLLSTMANGQLFRAYVASDGSDANPCTLAAPCRLLPAALTAVADGGEIWMLDSANYNTSSVVISKSVTILAIPGALGSVVALGGHALIVNGAGIRVTLRNLNVIPFAGNDNFTGISLQQAASLGVQGCNVTGFTTGIGLRATGASDVSVTDSTFRGNSFGAHFEVGARGTISGSAFIGSASVGISASAISSGVITVVNVDRSTVTHTSNNGLQVSATASTAIARISAVASSLSGNLNGALASSTNGGAGQIAVYNSQVTGNVNGLNAASGKIVAGGNLVAHNSNAGFLNISGTFESASNNVMRDNGVDTSGTVTSFVTQ